jgi:ADP-ribose pyrophosphatase YjhB (NUDIX family)
MWYRYSMAKRVSLVIVFDGDKVLLGKKPNGFWIPGGHAHTDESSLDAAVRELKEETNLDVSELKLFYSKISEDKIVDVYVCKKYSGNAQADDDLEEVHWFSVNELPEMRLDGNELVQKAYKEICL